MNSLLIFQLCTSLTLCMLAFWSREGVVFFVLSSSSHLTMGHVSPLPVSVANWRSLSLLWGSAPPSPKWRPHSQGPHTLPFQGTRQLLIAAEDLILDCYNSDEPNSAIIWLASCHQLFAASTPLIWISHIFGFTAEIGFLWFKAQVSYKFKN